jgi:hypothetical protein
MTSKKKKLQFPPDSKIYKKAYQLAGLSPDTEERFENQPDDLSINYRGIAGDPLIEPVPSFIKTSSEKCIEGSNNTCIVLGRDRPGSRISGYGGRGDTQAGCIDIVVGRIGADPKTFQENGDRTWADPSMKYDAARIYVSQKTDIDENFYLADGKVGNAKAKSAIGIKADGVRIVARDGIKLVTRTDGLNAQGGEIAQASGIDLIATNNDEELQPIPKGENLRESLERLVTHVDKLNGIVDSMLMYQMKLNRALIEHTHISPMKLISNPFGIGFAWESHPSYPVKAVGAKTMWDHMSQTKRSLMIHKSNLGTYKFKYFTPSGDKYINSRYNNTT